MGIERIQELHDLGCQYQDEKDYDSAIASFEEAIALGSSKINTICRLGKCYFMNGRISDGKQILEDLLIKHPNCCTALEYLVSYGIRANNYEIVKMYSRELIGLGAFPTWFMSDALKITMKNNDRQQLELLLSVAPSIENIKYYIKLDDFKTAEKLILNELSNRSIEDDEQYSKLNSYLIDCYLGLGKYTLAKEIIFSEYKKQKKEMPTMKQLVNYAIASKDIADTVDFIEKSLVINPYNIDCYLDLKKIYIATDDKENLSKINEKIVSICKHIISRSRRYLKIYANILSEHNMEDLSESLISIDETIKKLLATIKNLNM